MMNDVRFAFRKLRQSPTFTFIAIVTLALGIGANTAIFSVVRTVLLKRLPYPEPERLMIVNEYNTRAGDLRFAWPDFLDLRAQNHSFDDAAAYRQRHFSLTGAGEPVLIRGGEVSASFFSLLGAQPILGRTFSEAEDKPGADRIVVLSHQLWQDRFGGDAAVLGKTLTLDNVLYTVVGVLPRTFKFFERATDLYVPVGLEASDPVWIDRGNHPGLRVLARFRSDASLSTARRDLDAVMSRIEHDYPASNSGIRGSIRPIYEERFGNARPVLLILLAAAGCVILIACANIANLQLARAAERQKEFAIRTAVGAGQSRLIRQLLIESVLLAIIGGGLGLLLAQWTMDPLLRLAPADIDIPRLAETRIDGGALLFTFGLSILTGIFFGLAPAIQTFKIDLHGSLKENSCSTTASPIRQRLRAGLLVAQVALTVVLVIASGLLVRSLLQVQAVNPGFKIGRVLALDVILPASNYKTKDQQINFFTQAVARIRFLPGVSAAGAVFCPPLAGAWRSSTYLVADQAMPSLAELPSCLFNVADKGYFQVMQIPLTEGRYLNETDNADSPPVIVVNQNLARRWWPTQSALGKRIKPGRPETDEPYREIVGVVGDVKQDGLEAPQLPEMFWPVAQAPRQAMTLVVRTSTDPMSMAAAATREIHTIDPDLPVAKVQPMSRYLSDTLARRRFSTLLLGIFSGLALLLAFVGVYGVMSYSVAQRTHEIGVRMALGAQKIDMMTMVLRQSLAIVAIGLVIGLISALGATRLMSALLFGVGANDVTTYLIVVLLLGTAALIASYLPARRAMAVDPMIALRYE
jgi:putative ABC transport system permease protein